MNFAAADEVKDVDMEDQVCLICKELGSGMWQVNCCKKNVHYHCIVYWWKKPGNEHTRNKCVHCSQYPGDITQVSDTERRKFENTKAVVQRVSDFFKAAMNPAVNTPAYAFGEREKKSKSAFKTINLEKDLKAIHLLKITIEDSLGKIKELVESIAEKNYQARITFCQM